jgi:GNAT superfamily N-acetyltransferase
VAGLEGSGRMTQHQWVSDCDAVDWEELAGLYRAAPLGDKTAAELQVCFTGSRYVCLVYDQGRLIAAGRALADGIDCSYIADVAVHPDYQGTGVGKSIVTRLMELSAGHRKIMLYAARGKEDFYLKLGFKRMTTALAIFDDEASAIARGVSEG